MPDVVNVEKTVFARYPEPAAHMGYKIQIGLHERDDIDRLLERRRVHRGR